MYYRSLKCFIVSPDLRLERIMNEVPVPERFSVELQTVPSLDYEILGQADLLILDEIPEMSLLDIREHIKEDGRIYLCEESDFLSNMKEDELDLLDGLWPMPFSEAGIRYCYKDLLKRMKAEKDAWLVDNYLETLIDSVPDLIWFKDVKGAHLRVNNGFCRNVGKTKEQCFNRGHYYIWDLEPEDYAQGEYVCLETEEEVIQKRETCLFDEVVKTQKGMRQFQTYKSPIFDTDNTLIGTVGIAHDVTNLENIGKELEILLQGLPFPVLLSDENGVITKQNEHFLKTFNISEEDILGQIYQEWKEKTLTLPVDPDRDSFDEGLMQIIDKEKYLFVSEQPIMDIFHNCIGFFYIFRDVTTEYTLRKQILRSANTDFMTGLYNRRYLYKFVESIPDKTRITLLSMDLDNFKMVNDTYGHQVGDETIIEAAQLIQSHFEDGEAFRMGGDEFLVVLSGDWTKEQIRERAHNLLKDFCTKFDSRSEWNQLSASIGVASAIHRDMPLRQLFHRSDMALYKAKHGGKANCCFYSDIEAEEKQQNQ